MELTHRYSKLADLSKVGQITSSQSVPVARSRIHEARRRLSPETIAQLVADYEAGRSAQVLVEKYHLAKATVLKLLQQHGVTMRHQAMTEAEIAEAIRLYQHGWSLDRVGQHFNRHPSTIYGVLKQAGVARRKRWERCEAK